MFGRFSNVSVQHRRVRASPRTPDQQHSLRLVVRPTAISRCTVTLLSREWQQAHMPQHRGFSSKPEEFGIGVGGVEDEASWSGFRDNREPGMGQQIGQSTTPAQ